MFLSAQSAYAFLCPKVFGPEGHCSSCFKRVVYFIDRLLLPLPTYLPFPRARLSQGGWRLFTLRLTVSVLLDAFAIARIISVQRWSGTSSASSSGAWLACRAQARAYGPPWLIAAFQSRGIMESVPQSVSHPRRLYIYIYIYTINSGSFIFSEGHGLMMRLPSCTELRFVLSSPFCRFTPWSPFSPLDRQRPCGC